MAQLNAYLFFNGNCREAMNFYNSALGGELKLMTVGESPAAASMPGAHKDWIMHSSLMKDGFALLAADWMGPGKAEPGSGINLCFIGATRKEIEPVFATLSAGATNVDPLKQEFFGTFGALNDKFGVRWMFEADLPKT